jgi:hypothetical protein
VITRHYPDFRPFRVAALDGHFIFVNVLIFHVPILGKIFSKPLDFKFLCAIIKAQKEQTFYKERGGKY